MTKKKRARGDENLQAKDPFDLLEKIRRLQQAERPRTRNIVRRHKGGDVTFETVHTERVSYAPEDGSESASASFLPQSRDMPENGSLIGPAQADSQPAETSDLAAQLPVAEEVAPGALSESSAAEPRNSLPISCHEGQTAGSEMLTDHNSSASNDLQRLESPQIGPFPQTACQEIRSDQPSGDSHGDDDNPLSQLLAEAGGRVQRRRGRPTVLDDQAKGKLIALLAVGLSMRQAASVIGVSHTTVSDALKADRALAEEVTAARFNAQLQPLACVIRESRRSWRAASWLLKHLCNTISKREETPDEAQARYVREQEEFFARGRRK